jgi:hypothetical protein
MLALLFSVFGIFGCTSGKGDTASSTEMETCLEATPSIEIGEGERDFVAFSDPPEAMMVHGPQGGWHILGSLQFTGMEPIVEVHYQITHLNSGSLVSDNFYRLAMIETGDCQGYYPGMYGYLSVIDLYDGDLDTPPELLAGDALRMTFDVTDCLSSMEEAGECVATERTTTASLEVMALLDPIDQEMLSGDSSE